MTWWLVSAIGIAALKSFFFRGRNAVWGGATLGAIIGIVVAIARPEFDWPTVGHGAVIGAFFGLIAEILGAISDRMKRNG
jgi:hypothetical protein